MSQTVRISAGYSDKASENYQSRQYSFNLELDVQVNGSTLEIESASDRLFDICRRIVEKQKGVSVDNLLQRPEQPVQAPVQPVPVLCRYIISCVRVPLEPCSTCQIPLYFPQV
jgi:hypothetical protein